jgi:hypothetical protein
MTNCHKESIKTLVVLHGQRKAARIAGLSENTVKSWALRYHWNKLPKPSPHPVHPIRTQSPAAIVADELSQNKARSTLALSRYSARAAEQAAAHPKKLEIAGKVKDVASVHKTLWPEQLPANQILNLNILTGVTPPRIIPPGEEGHVPECWEKVEDKEEARRLYALCGYHGSRVYGSLWPTRSDGPPPSD